VGENTGRWSIVVKDQYVETVSVVRDAQRYSLRAVLKLSEGTRIVLTAYRLDKRKEEGTA